MNTKGNPNYTTNYTPFKKFRAVGLETGAKMC
jgi:hypothetical protein